MAFDSFIKIGDIKGEASDSKHKGEIEVLSFHWGVSNTGGFAFGAGGGTGKATVQDFSFVKRVDKASPILFQKCCEGEHIKDANFVVRKAGGTQLEYLKIKFTDVLVSSLRPGGSSQGADDIPLEEVSLNFGKCEFDYQPQSKEGKADGGPIHGGWNLAENIKA